MKCKRCENDFSWHDWAQKPFCSPFCKKGGVDEVEVEYNKHNKPYDPDRIINEYGVGKLEKTAEGQAVLRRARKKWAAELVQPGDPEFNKLYGKQVKEREEARSALQEQSRREWEPYGGRQTKVRMDT